jgi:chromosome segregation ATPase
MSKALRGSGITPSGIEDSDRQEEFQMRENRPLEETPPPSSRFNTRDDSFTHVLDDPADENTGLRERVSQLESLLAEAVKMAERSGEQQKDLEKLCDEKSDIIRELHVKLQEQPARAPAATPREEELIALGEELERERKQLREDEEALTAQMREMELQMSKERAELARQRNEVQRLHNEIKHELELASREASLRDRLQPLQRRQQDLMHRKGAEPSRAPAAEAPATAPAEPTPASEPKKGLFRWLGR